MPEPPSVKELKALADVVGRVVPFRSPGQLAALRAIFQRQQHVLYIAPTGQGKTLVAQMAMKLWPTTTQLILVLPYVTLYHEMERRFRASGNTVAYWKPAKSEPSANVVLVPLEMVNEARFLGFAQRISALGTLGVMVVDESQGIVEDPAWRISYRSLSRLGAMGAPFLLLTATAPPSHVHLLWEALEIKYEVANSVTEIRESTARTNLTYQLIPHATHVDKQKSIIPMIEFLRSQLGQHERGIVFVQTPLEATTLAAVLKCGTIHGEIKEPSMRAVIMDKFKQGATAKDRSWWGPKLSSLDGTGQLCGGPSMQIRPRQ